jgi:hypothetical protein
MQEGFSGSANAVYQYLIKYAHENDIPYGRNSRVIPPEDRNDHSVVSRPPRISIERVSRNTIYEGLLHVAATRKHELKQALLGLEVAPNDSRNKNNQSTSVEWVNKTRYADPIADIIFDTKPKDKHAKKN